MTDLAVSCQLAVGSKRQFFILHDHSPFVKNYLPKSGCRQLSLPYLINSSFNDKQKKYKGKGYADPLFYRVDEQ